MWPSSQNRGYASPESVASTPSCRWSGTGSGTDEASRLRWGDRGVGVGHLWEPSMGEPDCRLPQVTSADTPSWLERGLRRLGVGPGSTTTVSEGGAQVLILNHDAGSGPTSPVSSVQSHQHRTYILGQNVHLEPEELMEREIKRQKALEHQKAIRQQLEERDRRRKEERERRIREEQQEEERVRRDQEKEAQRLREEQRRQKEKEEKDARRAQAIREALEEAERRALLERPTRLQVKKQQRQQQQQPPEPEDEDAVECRMCDKSDANTPRRRPEDRQQQLPVALLPPQPPPSPPPAPAPLRAALEAGPICTAESLPVVAAEGVAVMLDSVGVSSPGLQLALLVPQQPSRKDTSTQTETSPRGKARKKSASLERPQREGRLPLRSRSRSQSHPRGPLPLEERPKWGVNRPGHAYVKQSERDPHYQRRQQRGQQRQGGHGRRNNNAVSSDENSRSPSPSTASVTGKTTMASRRRAAGPLLDLRPHLAKHHRHHQSSNNGNGGQRLLSRRTQEDKPKRSPPDEDLWSSVRPVVTQLTSLRQCLLLKHQEWESPRSQTPFSEKSWNA